MRTITITTAQKVSIDYELASLRDRIMAFLLDQVIIIAFLIFFMIFYSILLASGSEVGEYLVYILFLPVFLFYTLVQEVFNHGQTLGKKVLGIKVIKINGEVPTLSEYIVRWGFRFIDINATMGVVASILVSSSDKGQRLGGLLSNTTVIKTKSSVEFNLEDILKIESIEEYKPKYRAVTQLEEEEVILIKQVIERYKKYKNEASKEALNKLVIKLKKVLRLENVKEDEMTFLSTLIKDYIVLTR